MLKREIKRYLWRVLAGIFFILFSVFFISLVPAMYGENLGFIQRGMKEGNRVYICARPSPGFTGLPGHAFLLLYRVTATDQGFPKEIAMGFSPENGDKTQLHSVDGVLKSESDLSFVRTCFGMFINDDEYYDIISSSGFGFCPTKENNDLNFDIYKKKTFCNILKKEYCEFIDGEVFLDHYNYYSRQKYFIFGNDCVDYVSKISSILNLGPTDHAFNVNKFFGFFPLFRIKELYERSKN